MTTTVAPRLELIKIASSATTDDLKASNHKPKDEVMTRTFVGGSVGNVYPTLQNVRAVGGSAGWVHHW